MKKSSYFPLVGILASKGRKKDTFRGDIPFYKAIQKELSQQGGLSFVFTTEGIQDHTINGYVYFSSKGKWGKISFPFPDMIYNKISTRSEEMSNEFKAIKQLYYQQNKPFFNPTFFNKWTSFQALSQEKQLQRYLPKTWLFSDESNIYTLLRSHSALYAKPLKGHKGNGIVKLSMDNNSYVIHSKSERVQCSESEFKLWMSRFLKKKKYLLQEEIKTDKIDDCKYDLRILCLHKSGAYVPIGIGVRKALKDSILTHVPNGGEILSFDSVKARCSIDQIHWLVGKVGEVLTNSFGFIGEFSMDLGLTQDGFPFLFEVNSKPMVFDEKEIQQQRVRYLCELFTELTQNTKNR